MKVREIMSQPVITVTEDTPLARVAQLMLDRGIGGLPVIDSAGALTGIVTESDFTAREKCLPFSLFRFPQLFGAWLSSDAEQLYASARNTPVCEVMSTSVVTVHEDDTIEKVLELMLKHDINRIPVLCNGKPVGIVARRDLLKVMRSQQAVAA